MAQKYSDENYIEETISLTRVNIYSAIIFLPIIVAFILPYYFLWNPSLSDFNTSGINSSLIFIIFIIVGLFLHEFLHAITWVIADDLEWKDINFGIKWKALAPYVHCTRSLKVANYRLGIIMPFIGVGLLPYLFGLLAGKIWFILYGVLFIISAIGDFISFKMLMKYNQEDLVQDHPNKLGFYIIKQGDEYEKNSRN